MGKKNIDCPNIYSGRFTIPKGSEESDIKQLLITSVKEDSDYKQKCVKCGYTLIGLGDDYFCVSCNSVFCWECIAKHGCDVESYSIGNKHNFVRKMRKRDIIKKNINKKSTGDKNKE